MEFQEQIIESQKKLLITLSFFVIALEGFAQSRGYEGNVYLGGGIGAIVGMGLTDDDCYLSVFMQMK